MKTTKTTLYRPLVVALITVLSILLLISSAKAQILIDTIPDWDHDDIANIKIQYSGDWVHMEKGGSYPNNDQSTAVYQFWGFGIDVYTEEFPNHDYYVIEIDGMKDTVKIDGSKNRDNWRTYYNHKLKYGDHTVKFYAPRYGFVLNKLVKYVDSDPNMHPYWADTVIMRDSIVWDIDTLKAPDVIIPPDTTKLPDVILPPDTTKLPDFELPGDTIRQPPVIIPGDTLNKDDVVIIGDLDCPELDEELEDQEKLIKRNNILLIVLSGLIIIVSIVTISKLYKK